jgi:hypothetical protein
VLFWYSPAQAMTIRKVGPYCSFAHSQCDRGIWIANYPAPEIRACLFTEVSLRISGQDLDDTMTKSKNSHATELRLSALTNLFCCAIIRTVYCIMPLFSTKSSTYAGLARSSPYQTIDRYMRFICMISGEYFLSSPVCRFHLLTFFRYSLHT